MSSRKFAAVVGPVLFWTFPISALLTKPLPMASPTRMPMLAEAEARVPPLSATSFNVTVTLDLLQAEPLKVVITWLPTIVVLPIVPQLVVALPTLVMGLSNVNTTAYRVWPVRHSIPLPSDGRSMSKSPLGPWVLREAALSSVGPPPPPPPHNPVTVTV